MKDKRPYESIYDIEIAPPTNIWNEISTELDHQKIAQKLLRAEQTPPAKIWNRIERTLHPTNYSISIFRYAAAAAAIIGLAFVGNYFYQTNLEDQKEKDALYLAETANTAPAQIEIFTNSHQNSYSAPVVKISEEENFK